MSESPAPLMVDYNTPPPDRRRQIKGWYMLYVVPAIFGLLSVGFTLLFHVPTFREFFKDFRVSLPRLTEWALAASEAARSPLVWMGAIVLVLALPLPIAIWTDRPTDPAKRFKRAVIVLLLMILLILGINFVVNYALNLPAAEAFNRL